MQLSELGICDWQDAGTAGAKPAAAATGKKPAKKEAKAKEKNGEQPAAPSANGTSKTATV
jgi:hypothetical protein